MPRPARLTVQLNAYSPYRLWSIAESLPDRLSRSFPGIRVVQSRDRETFVRLLPEAEVLFTWSLPRRHFASARRLRWIHTPEAGVDQILYPEIIRSPVRLTNSRGLSADAVADHAMGLVYAYSRRLAESRDAQRQRIWARDLIWSSDRIPFALARRTLLVVGLGEAGRGIARRARAAGMTVIGVRRRSGIVECVDELCPLSEIDAVLPRADVIVLALPLTPETRNVLNAERFTLVKPGALLVNVGRGALLDEKALADALSTGRLGGAGLDVFAAEPLPRESPFWGHPKVMVTPHLAGTDPTHMERATELFEANLARFIAGDPLINEVDKTAGY